MELFHRTFKESDWSMAPTAVTWAELKYCIMEHGVQSVMTFGHTLTLEWPAGIEQAS